MLANLQQALTRKGYAQNTQGEVLARLWQCTTAEAEARLAGAVPCTIAEAVAVNETLFGGKQSIGYLFAACKTGSEELETGEAG